MANLIDTIGPQLSADTLQKLGANLGVDPAKLKPAATTAAAATLDAVAGIGATKEGADRIIKLLPSGVDDLSNLLRSSEGIQNLGKLGAATTAALFGDNRAGVVDCIASSNGISKSAARFDPELCRARRPGQAGQGSQEPEPHRLQPDRLSERPAQLRSTRPSRRAMPTACAPSSAALRPRRPWSAAIR